jgi:hypothetical protein
MSREYKIDVLVETHGAVEEINRVADAENRIVDSSNKSSIAVDRLGASHKGAATEVRGLGTDFDTTTISAAQADRALSEMHIAAQNLPSTFQQVRGGLNAVAEGAGLTVAELGLMGAAGLVVGTAMAAWQVGRTVAEFFDLDNKIAHTTATLMGWGDVVAEAAGAKADSLARASKIAGREITDLGEALEINGRQVQDWNDKVARANAPRESVIQIERWNQELDKVKSAGVLGALTRDIESHNFSHQELADRYRISTAALSFYTNEMRDAEAESKAYDAQLKKQHAEEAKAIADEIRLHKQLQAEHTEILRISTAITK